MPNTEIPPFFTTSIKCASTSLFLIVSISVFFILEAFAMAFRDVYTFGPAFRAENSNTSRHASEFWMIEPEIAFADLEDDMDLIEDMVKYCIDYVLDNAPEEIECQLHKKQQKAA